MAPIINNEPHTTNTDIAEVRNYYEHIPHTVERLHQRSILFEAGQIRFCLPQWQRITEDRDILKLVEGVVIELSDLPSPTRYINMCFSQDQTQAIDSEMKELLRKKVVVPCSHSPGEFISPIFVVPKKDNKFRMILNLKKLNESVDHHHFKMETLKYALSLISQNCFFCSLDLRDAYFSVPVAPQSQEFLKFVWKGTLYKFTALPNGLASCPRMFTKLLKPVMAHLHKLGFISTIFIDDSLLIAHSEIECIQNVTASLALFELLGFVIHPVKSVLKPTHRIVYLGFVLDSVDMTVTLTEEKKVKIQNFAVQLLDMGVCSVRMLAKFIGQVVASFQGVMYGPLWYRQLEKNKLSGLKLGHGDYDSMVVLSEEAKIELKWWRDHILTAYNFIDTSHGDPTFVIFSDASLTGWGCYCELGKTGGHWKNSELGVSINALELKAGLFALQTFASDKLNIHLRLMMDNTCAVSCVNKFGTSHSDICNSITKDIWDFCIVRNIWISAAYVPGVENTAADEESRNTNMDTEWRLNTDLLTQALGYLDFTPEIDLFATRINSQYPRYMSFKPDPTCETVDSFSVSWHGLVFYAFPPFSVIPNVLQKICRDKARGVIVVPDWPNQPWYAAVAKILIKRPVLLSARNNLLALPQDPEKTHRLKKLRLIICAVSGDVYESRVFRTQLPQLYVPPGVQGLKNDMHLTSVGGAGMRVEGKLIPFHRL